LDRQLDCVAGHPDLKGLVLMSAKKSIFIAGADLKSIAGESDPEALAEFIEFGQSVLNRITSLPMITVAAIHGACVGGGFEMSLACHWRVASPDRVTQIGLPETQIGVIPAWGGSTRLPRLIGLPKALDIILAGKTLAPKLALRYGMIDAVVPREYLLQVARQKIFGGPPERSRHWLTNNPLSVAAIRSRAAAGVQRKTHGRYPAVTKALDVMTKGLTRSIGESLELEVETVLELAQKKSTQNLLRLFFQTERAKKLSLLPANGSTESARTNTAPRCAVIGAGVMGSGIAQWLSSRGFPTILRDVGPDQVARGMSNISHLYADAVKHHVFTPTEARAGLDRIFPAATEVPLANRDFVIEAAVEEMALKKEIFRKLDALAGPQTILATNTSALSVSEIAGATGRPDRVVGIHFFNPVHRMKLVEVVRTPLSSPEAVQRAIQLVQQMGKLPLLVNDSPGFLVNRILIPYLIEAGLLFDAGADAHDLDAAMLHFGMPMGPLRLLDEVGLDVAHHICGTIAEQFPGRFRVPEVLGKMVQAGLLGRKTGRGFYIHAGKSAELNTGTEIFRVNDSARELSREDLRERMALLMINEGARCLEENVVTSAEDVDFGMVMGTGFAPFRGGPLRYADCLGMRKVVLLMRRWVEKGESHFEPCDLLVSMAENGKPFHPDGKGLI
jgi:3-hydroxyacyl-CoA dehydrogenase/enoyl-CoA hydratase/3-hydroxybutyryl-CoA epimerase